MSVSEQDRELLRILERFEIDGNPVTVGGRRVADVVRELIEAPRLPAELVPVIKAIARVKETERHLDRARDEHDAAEPALAELMGTKRRDKDMGFDADFDARRMIVDAALAAVAGDADIPSGQD